MNNDNNWNLLEKLSDPSASAEERKELLHLVESDPELLKQWKAFRILQQWPELENLEPGRQDTDGIVLQMEREGTVDMGIKRAFPYVAAVALAY